MILVDFIEPFVCIQTFVVITDKSNILFAAFVCMQTFVIITGKRNMNSFVLKFICLGHNNTFKGSLQKKNVFFSEHVDHFKAIQIFYKKKPK